MRFAFVKYRLVVDSDFRLVIKTAQITETVFCKICDNFLYRINGKISNKKISFICNSKNRLRFHRKIQSAGRLAFVFCRLTQSDIPSVKADSFLDYCLCLFYLNYISVWCQYSHHNNFSFRLCVCFCL